MAEVNPDDKGSAFSRLPQWPVEARDVPDDKRYPEDTKRRFYVYLLGPLGCLAGALIAVAEGARFAGGSSLGHVLLYAVIGWAVAAGAGWLVDHYRWERGLRRHPWDKS
jgi:hypothetical protein